MRRVLAVVCVVAAFAAALHACGDERRPITGSGTPTAEDPAFGYIGNVLIAEESTGPDGQTLRMWIGFSTSSLAFQGIQADRGRLLDGEPLVIGGTVVPSADHALGFYFDPLTTRTAADVDGLTTLGALRADPRHPERARDDRLGGSWVRVRVVEIVETPPRCDDGFVQVAEDCDSPGSPCQGRFEVDTVPRACASDCTCPPACGNGVVDDSIEQCDDGNQIDGDGCSGCVLDPVQVQRDFATGFRAFAFRAMPGLGFCPQRDALRHVAIDRDPVDGELHLEATIFGDPSGWDPSGFFDCPGDVVVPRHALTASASTRVLDAFSRVVVTETPGLRCGSADPCIIRLFAWTNVTADGAETEFAADDDECAPRLLDDEVLRLLGVLEEIVPGTATPAGEERRR